MCLCASVQSLPLRPALHLNGLEVDPGIYAVQLAVQGMEGGSLGTV